MVASVEAAVPVFPGRVRRATGIAMVLAAIGPGGPGGDGGCGAAAVGQPLESGD